MINKLGLIVLILLVGCAGRKVQIIAESDYVDFVNSNKMGARADTEVTTDKYFKLKIPSEPVKVQNIADGNLFKYFILMNIRK